MTRRTCRSCGAVLAQDNSGRKCGPCIRTAMDTAILTAQTQVAKEVSWVFTHPFKYRTPRKYLRALTHALRNLARVHGEDWQVDVPAPFENIKVSEGGYDLGGEVQAEPPSEVLQVVGQ